MRVLRRLALPLVLCALVAGTAFGASASQTRGKSNRAAILKNRAARGEKGRVKTQFVRDTGTSSLVKVLKLDGKGKPTGQVEAYLVNKKTGVAKPTDVSALQSKTTAKAPTAKAPAAKAPAAKAPAAKAPTAKTQRRAIPKRTVPKKPATRVASATEATPPAAAEQAPPETGASVTAAADTAAPETKAPKASGPVVMPLKTAARSAVMSDPIVAASESVAAMNPEAITPAEAMAMALAEQRLKVIRRADYDVVPTFEQSRGDKTNPVTGSGMIELVATKKVTGSRNIIRRFLHAFNPNARRRVEIVLDQTGAPAYMVDRADSTPYRMVRQLVETVPLRDLVNDLVRSEGVRKGGVMGILAGGLAFVTGPVGWGVVAGVAPMAWKSAVNGIRQRQVARQTALTDAVTEIKQSIKDGNTVTIEEAYETYKAKLGEIKQGTAVDAPSTPATPVSRRDFIKAISAPPHNL